MPNKTAQSTGRTKQPRSFSATLIGGAKTAGRSSLLESEAEQVAKEYGIPIAKGKIARNEREALQIAKSIGYPVVMKIVSTDILHKTDVGGVRTGVNSSSEVRESFRSIIRSAKKARKNASIDGVFIQKMAPKSYEFVAGATRDPQFGPTLMFGLGGIFVEIFKDVAFRLAPVSREEALRMMKEIKAASLLTGFRGSKALDLGAAADVLVSLGDLMRDFDSVDSIDINPLFIYPRGALAVDVRIILKQSKNETKTSKSGKKG